MIAKILKTSSSGSGPVLDYNEKKVTDGNASVVDVENLPGDDMATIYDTFDEYESNPAIAEQVKKKSLHLTFGPGPGDRITDEECVEMIKEAMREMGYGEQPYVIYKHYDIDREHFHVVSTRIAKNGKKIDTRHQEGWKLREVMKGLEQKYHFKLGIDKDTIGETTLPVVQAKEFSPKDPNVLVSLKTLFDEALKYDFHSFYQFQCVMAAMNVRVLLRKRKDGGNSVVLQGLHDSGKVATRRYSMEKHLDYNAGELYASRLDENNAMGILQLDRKVAIRAISDFCLSETGSAEEYCAALEEAGIRHVVTRDDATSAIKRVTLIEKNTYSLVDSATRGELFLKPFQDAEKTGRWTAPPYKSKRAAPGAKVRRKGSAPFFTPDRSSRMKAAVSTALDRYRNPSGVRVGPGIGNGGHPALPGRKLTQKK